MANLLAWITTASSKNSKTSSSEPPKIKEEEGYYVWNKGEVLQLSPHFFTKEMSCHCHYPDCKKQRISKILIEKLESVRTDVKQPLIVTSAFRCQKYQAFLRASGVNTVVAQLSQHELGNAADIVPQDEKNVRTTFLDICAKYFQAIGLSNAFLHVDLRTGKERRWEY